MLFTFKAKAAYQLAGVSDLAATKSARPILASVKLEVDGKWDDDEPAVVLRAVATDSHALVTRELSFPVDEVDFDLEDDAELLKDGVMIDAKDWKKTLKELASGAGPLPILLEVTSEGIEACIDSRSTLEYSLPAQNIGHFPNWRQLFGEHTYDSLDEWSYLPTFQPTLLAKLEKVISAKPADRNGVYLDMWATGTEDAHFKPWLFTNRDKSLRILVMPARADRGSRKADVPDKDEDAA